MSYLSCSALKTKTSWLSFFSVLMWLPISVNSGAMMGTQWHDWAYYQQTYVFFVGNKKMVPLPQGSLGIVTFFTSHGASCNRSCSQAMRLHRALRTLANRPFFCSKLKPSQKLRLWILLPVSIEVIRRNLAGKLDYVGRQLFASRRLTFWMQSSEEFPLELVVGSTCRSETRGSSGWLPQG